MVDSFWSQFLISNENIFNKEQPLLYTFLKQLKPLEFQENKISVGCENRGLKIF
jgi:hypothetical protein